MLSSIADGPMVTLDDDHPPLRVGLDGADLGLVAQGPDDQRAERLQAEQGGGEQVPLVPFRDGGLAAPDLGIPGRSRVVEQGGGRGGDRGIVGVSATWA